MTRSKLAKFSDTLVFSGLAAMLVVALRAALRPKARRTDDRVVTGRRVVIVGAGFGGLEAAQRLAQGGDIDLTVIDRNNYTLFQPLLYQVATAGLSPDDITYPIRDALAPHGRAVVRMETVTGIDTGSREVVCGQSRISYDALILATGSEVSYFGHREWRKVAPGMKTLDDALALRRKILSAFEQAALSTSPADRSRLLTFVLVGGGPTGVEMAGSIAELARDMLPKDFPGLREAVRIVIVEAESKMLTGFAPRSSRYAESQLGKMGVEVRTGVRVTDIEPGCLKLGEKELIAGTVIWTAGVEATPIAQWLGVTPQHGLQVQVGPDLQVSDHPEIYVIGDAALVFAKGKKLPGLASVAKQQGRYVADRVRASLTSDAATKPFRYRDYGALATIGRTRAVADLGPLHLHGTMAWSVWAAAHIFFLVGFRDRVLVSAQWLISYVTHKRGARVIT